MEILIGNLYSVRVSFSLAASLGSATALRGTEQEISLRLARAPGGRHSWSERPRFICRAAWSPPDACIRAGVFFSPC